MPLTIQVAQKKFKDWKQFKEKLAEAKEPIFIRASTLSYNHEDAVHEVHGFTVSVGLKDIIGGELLIYPIDCATTETSHTSETMRVLQETVIADMMSLKANVKHDVMYRFPSGMVYRFLEVDSLMNGQQLKKFKDSYFYPAIAVLGHADFKVFSVTVCSSEVIEVEAAQ